MRLNAKIFSIADGIEPVEKQEFDNRLVEVYYINDFQMLFDQYLPKGRFAIWASVDGFNYRLFIEKGYFEKLGELYTDRVNKVWLDFWDKCDDVTKKYNFRVMLPVAIACILLFFIVTLIPMGKAAIWVQLAVLAVFIITMMMLNKKVRAKINLINADSVDDIKEIVGKDHFDELLVVQNKYIDDFFEAQAKLAEEEAEKEAADEERSNELVENNGENLETPAEALEDSENTQEPTEKAEENTEVEALEVEAELVDEDTTEKNN